MGEAPKVFVCYVYELFLILKHAGPNVVDKIKNVYLFSVHFIYWHFLLVKK